jgi:hypothetical protein
MWYLTSMRNSEWCRLRHAIVLINDEMVRVVYRDGLVSFDDWTDPAGGAFTPSPTLQTLTIDQLDDDKSFWSSSEFGQSLKNDDGYRQFLLACLFSIHHAIREKLSDPPFEMRLPSPSSRVDFDLANDPSANLVNMYEAKERCETARYQHSRCPKLIPARFGLNSLDEDNQEEEGE